MINKENKMNLNTYDVITFSTDERIYTAIVDLPTKAFAEWMYLLEIIKVVNKVSNPKDNVTVIAQLCRGDKFSIQQNQTHILNVEVIS